ncbi:hypothetical protein DAI22_03g031500 [Oryza sativa Japonica Group]|nr:hypothetical protein DAI22_03g031500 [Oryza sativa Japonica Group]
MRPKLSPVAQHKASQSKPDAAVDSGPSIVRNPTRRSPQASSSLSVAVSFSSHHEAEEPGAERGEGIARRSQSPAATTRAAATAPGFQRPAATRFRLRSPQVLATAHRWFSPALVFHSGGFDAMVWGVTGVSFLGCLRRTSPRCCTAMGEGGGRREWRRGRRRGGWAGWTGGTAEEAGRPESWGRRRGVVRRRRGRPQKLRVREWVKEEEKCVRE